MAALALILAGSAALSFGAAVVRGAPAHLAVGGVEIAAAGLCWLASWVTP